MNGDMLKELDLYGLVIITHDDRLVTITKGELPAVEESLDALVALYTLGMLANCDYKIRKITMTDQGYEWGGVIDGGDLAMEIPKTEPEEARD